MGNTASLKVLELQDAEVWETHWEVSVFALLLYFP